MIAPENLAGFDLFRDVAKDVLGEISGICQTEKFPRDSFVFHEGDTADKLHLLISGSIALRVNLTSRPDFVTVSFINTRHQALGWSGMVRPSNYTASAFCEEDVELISIPTDKFMEILDRNPEAGYKIMLRISHIISDRLRNSRQALLKTI